jgi:mannose-6-phosphate isomerase
MAIELARTRAVPKPWGVVGQSPWHRAGSDSVPIGEIWYERPGNSVLDPSLLLKLLFTSQPLSMRIELAPAS